MTRPAPSPTVSRPRPGHLPARAWALAVRAGLIGAFVLPGVLPARAWTPAEAERPAATGLPLPGDTDLPAVRLSPRVRAHELPAPAAPSLPAARVLPYLHGLRLIEPQALAQAALIVAGPAGRSLIAPGDPAYARGPDGTPLRREALPPGARLAVLRPARVLQDPITGDVLGHETRQVALARLVRDEEDAGAGQGPARLDISDAHEELRLGDRLLPVQEADPPAYTPHAPARPVSGRIVAVDRSGAEMAGPREGVVINRGRLDGLEPGHLLSVHRIRPAPGGSAGADTPRSRQVAEEHTGLLMVVRVRDRLAQALVLQASDGIRAGDTVGSVSADSPAAAP